VNKLEKNLIYISLSNIQQTFKKAAHEG